MRRRNVHLRGWQRAGLSNGEGDMIAERQDTPLAGEAKGPDGSGPKAALLADISAVAVPGFSRYVHLYLFLPDGVDKCAVTGQSLLFFFLVITCRRTHVPAPSA